MKNNFKDLLTKNIFRKFISCDCYEHLLSVETAHDDPVVRLRWWSVPGMQDTRLITRIRAAWKMLKGEALSIDDFILTTETTAQLIESLLDAQNIMNDPHPQTDEETAEIYAAIRAIKMKYGTLPKEEDNEI